MNKLAIFDFDGTITSRDSFLAFLLFSHKPLRFWLNAIALAPVLLLFCVRLVGRHEAKQTVFRRFFAGMSFSEFMTITRAFTDSPLVGILRQEAMQSIHNHLNSGHKVIVLSASPDLILSAFCSKHNLQLIGTQVELIHESLTGKFASENCRGQEKVRRLKEVIDLDQFDYIYAYGDTPSDKLFMALADEAYYKPFRT